MLKIELLWEIYNGVWGFFLMVGMTVHVDVAIIIIIFFLGFHPFIEQLKAAVVG